jgi:CRISPR system Cascade subunit CasD
MPCLLLRMAAPLQSWGTQSPFSIRDSGREPSKSGVLGLLAAALGRSRHESLEDLASLSMGVRVDKEGTPLRDFHTIGGGRSLGRDYGVYKANGDPRETAISTRWYLQDALFLVALHSENRIFLEKLEGAIRNPVYPLFLGRRSCPPTFPLLLGIFEIEIEKLLREYPLLDQRASDKTPYRRLVLECAAEEGTPRMDVPISFDPLNRKYRTRYVKNLFCSPPVQQREKSLCKGEEGCSFPG